MWNTSGAGQALDLGERADRPHPADAGQDLLLDPVLLVAAVQPVGDTAQIVFVLRDVGIQQQQRNSADLGDPDARPQLRAVRHGQLAPGPALPCASVSSRNGSPCGSSDG